MARVFEVLAMLVIAAFLVLSLDGDHPTETPIRAAIVENGVADTGAVNLVTAVYLGYRAFDTLGETVVLLLAVSGVIFLVRGDR
ncbi:MAG: hydrogen gas-evolving membrane-bound hydrogenase subunit E [Spirochaetota bacterium]